MITGVSGAGPGGNASSPPAWMEFCQTTQHGYTRVHVRNHKLTLDFVQSDDGKIIDTVTVDSKFKHQGASASTKQQARVSKRHHRALHEKSHDF
jgi:hypothetical protein